MLNLFAVVGIVTTIRILIVGDTDNHWLVYIDMAQGYNPYGMFNVIFEHNETETKMLIKCEEPTENVCVRVVWLLNVWKM